MEDSNASNMNAPVVTHSSLFSLMQNHLDSAVKKVEISPPQPNNGSSLMAFANTFLASQLSKSPSNNLTINPSEGKFVIPNFSNIKGSKNGGLENLVSKLHIRSSPINIPQRNIDERNNGSLSFSAGPSEKEVFTKPTQEHEDDWVIDLSHAIIKTDAVAKVTTPNIEAIEEILTMEFIDCDLDIVPPIVDDTPRLPCLFYDANAFIPTTSRKRASYKKMSTMGKVICMNPKDLRKPHIEFKYYNALEVQMFKFDVPSPDEIILENLKTKKGILSRRTFLEP